MGIVAKQGFISVGFFLFDWVETALVITVAKPELMHVGFFCFSCDETTIPDSFTMQFSEFVGLENDTGSARRKVFLAWVQLDWILYIT